MKYRVNIDEANETKSGLSRIIDGKDYRLLNRVGAFASLFRIDASRYKDPVLVLKTEEPGTKQVLAFQNGRVESICYDMVNHLVNDCMVMGAEPLAVQDLVVCGRLEKATVTRIVSAVSEACAKQGCALTGGETTEQPDILPPETYILGSCIVGVADYEDVIDGTKIRMGDTIIALASSGPHTNGYTLIRDLLRKHPDLQKEPVEDTTFLDAVLKPHRCYYQSVKRLFGGHVVGLAHITGGGIKENLNRILPQDVDAVIDLGCFRPQPVFEVIRRFGGVSDDDMLRTFNLGVGLTVVCREQNAHSVIEILRDAGEKPYLIGRIVSGSGKVQCNGRVKYSA
jgi:phosphoribosylformylglycinamidine cyclo-ligase